MSDVGVDWVRGISYSILASIIGGASKLSIRKSWLIAAELKQRAHLQTHHDSEDLDLTKPNGSDAYQSKDNDKIPPLEVSGSSRTESTQEDSPNPNDDDNYFFFNPLREPNQIISMETSKYKQKTISWILYISGMIGMTFLNPLFCVLAMKYSNPSMLAPFSGLTLVWVVLFSGYAIGEPASSRQQVACALIIFGQVTVAAFGDHTNKSDVTVDELIESYKEPDFLVFIIFTMVAFAFMGISIYAGSSTSLLQKMSWGTIGGTITGFQNFLKDALTVSKTKPLHPVFFFLASLAMLTAFVGLLFLAACMKRYDATYSASMFVVSFIVSATLMSAVHYHTFQDLEGIWDYIMYPIGLIILLAGASMLVREERPSSRNPEINDFAEEKMDTERLLPC